MKHLTTQIEINAPAERVWNILTQFDKYPDWNPMIRSLSGTVEEGQIIKVLLQQPGGSTMTFKPEVVSFKPGREFAWQGKLLMKGLFDGMHQFLLLPMSESTTVFIHREEFNGILVPLFSKMIDTKTREGFELMNRKLKELAEAPAT